MNDKKAIAEWEREFRRQRGLGPNDPVPVSLPSPVFEEDHARLMEEERWRDLEAGEEDGPVSLPKMSLEPGAVRRLDQERWLWREAEQGRQPHRRIVNYGSEISGQEGSDSLAGGAGGDRIAKPAVKAKIVAKGPARLPMDVGSLDRGGFGEMVVAKLPTDVDAVMADPSATEVGDSKMWPVPGNGRVAKRREIGPNGRRYSDGRYSPKGGFRGKDDKGNLITHQGMDLPAAVGRRVAAAEDGEVFSQGNQPEGWGNYVAIRHSDGRIAIYAHLDSYKPMRNGTKVVQGQEIGKVGVTGNAGKKGSHLHLEIREDRGDKTLRKISDGAVSLDPSTWIRTRRVAR